MRKRVQSIISVLCALALLLGCMPAAMAESVTAVTLSVITVQWDDANNQDGSRPAQVKAELMNGGAVYDSVTLNEENNWTGMLAAPAPDCQWKAEDVDGYEAEIKSAGDGTTVVTLTHKPETLGVSLKLDWQGDQNAQALRPENVNVQVLSNGLPCAVATLNAGNGWKAEIKDLPKYKNESGSAKEISYTLAAPEVDAYTVKGSGDAKAGFSIVCTLGTGTLTVNRQAEGAPAGANLSKLTYEISGPDSRLPVTVADARYVLENAAPGSYLVKEIYQEGAVNGYTLDAQKSVTTAAVRVKAGENAAITLKNVFVEKEDKEGTEKAGAAPAAEDLGKLTFIIDGPDERMPLTVSYSQFTGGKFTLDNVQCGTYTVVETNAGTLLNEYNLVVSESTQGILVQVQEGGQAPARLTNVYVNDNPNDENPEDQITSIPVVKTWVDNDDRDMNRPESVTVRLLANNVEVASAALTAEGGWSHVFENLPTVDAQKQPIQYTVTEDEVPLYETTINGSSIINVYKPDLTTASVTKVWNDRNNALGLRPSSIYAILSDGTRTVATVVLSEANNWTATVNNLPTIVNGQPAVYTWREQAVLGYQLEKAEVNGSMTTFTNKLYERPTPPPGTKGPKNPGTPYLIIEEYGTPLGVEIIINHVGDCFD